MLSGVRLAARRKLFKSEAEWMGVNWPDSTCHHWWTTLENNFVLEASKDEYGGVVVDADKLPPDEAAFAGSFMSSLSYWKSVLRPQIEKEIPKCIDSSLSLVLVVQEKYRGWVLDGVWKLPTGFIQESEEIYTRAIREVQEETGVDTSARSRKF
ncbi:hypothetical protein ZWY2020_003734 [Hordeum vulgare]|nr:hypothetical protein ZWY2020_003734 [Hordeum vulgare]